MNLKDVIKRMTPPVLLDIYRRHAPHANGHIWEGIYRHYRDVPITGEGLNSATWVGIARLETEAVLSNVGICGALPTLVTGERNLLALLASFVCQHAGRIRILDFGGGMGIDYVFLVNGLMACQAIDYHVVESDNICTEGNLLFAKENRIQFHRSLPVDLYDVDVVHISSALQYIEDYAGLLKDLCAYRPQYFLFTRLSAGDFPTYASAQKNLPGMTLAYWFINVHEIIESMSANGYSPIFKSASEQEYDQSNFPAEFRLRRTCNLLFKRSGNA